MHQMKNQAIWRKKLVFSLYFSFQKSYRTKPNLCFFPQQNTHTHTRTHTPKKIQQQKFASMRHFSFCIFFCLSFYCEQLLLQPLKARIKDKVPHIKPKSSASLHQTLTYRMIPSCSDKTNLLRNGILSPFLHIVKLKLVK